METAHAQGETYVYGVVRSDHPGQVSVAGVGGEPVACIDDGALRALASAAPAGPVEATRENLTAHFGVLREARERGVVVPLRFGLVMPDADTLRSELLAANEQQLVQLLAELDGRWEMTVRAAYDEDSLLREIVGGRSDVARLREEVRRLPGDASYFARVRLGELVAGAVEAQRERDAALVIERLAPHAVDVRTAETASSRVALKAAFLVDEERLGEFDAAVEAVAAELRNRLRFKAVGPLPAHSFADLSLPVGSAA